MNLLGLRRLHGRRRPVPLVGDLDGYDPSAVAVDRYRRRQEHEADTVAFVLDGLDVGSLSELHELVRLGRGARA